MDSTKKTATAIFGLALLVVYSVIMMMSGGAAGDWAWIVLVAGIALLVIPAIAAINSGSRNDG